MKKSRLLLILFSLICISCMGDKVYLTLNVKPGDVFKSRSTVTQHITQMIDNNSWEMDQVIIIDYGYYVQEKDDQDNIKIQVTYDGIGFIQDGPMGHFEYRSWEDDKEIPAMAQGFATMVGQSFNMTVSPRWKVIALEGLNELIEEMINAIEIPQGMSREQIKQNYQNQFGDESMKENMEQMFVFYPDLPVRPGDIWSFRANLKKGFPMLLETQYELYEVNDDEIRLKTNSSIKPSTQPDVMQLGGVMMKYNLRGRQSGYVIIDRSSGWIKLIELKQEFDGQVQVSDRTGRSYFRFPLTVSGEIKTELIKY